LAPSQGTELIQHIAKDELQFCLWLKQGVATWDNEHSPPLWIHNQITPIPTLNLTDLLHTQDLRLQKWQNCSSNLLSVHQRPYFAPGWERDNFSNPGSLNIQILKELTQVLRGRTSIRQLSLLLNKDELDIAQILSPYIEEKIIYLHHPQSPLDSLPNIPKDIKTDEQLSSTSLVSHNENRSKNLAETTVKVWNIVCIDDSPTILKEMQRFLDQDKFRVTTIDDPVQAVSKIFQINPDLILLDITMPRINGYKLCGLLRSSGNCDETPIIMVTGNTGLIDKARAKLAGATDYLTKPFTQQGLRQIVEKYLQ
ncbi:MAG: response regulator, partial [Waterburya sp.]